MACLLLITSGMWLITPRRYVDALSVVSGVSDTQSSQQRTSFDTVANSTCKIIVSWRLPEELRTPAAELGPALFAAFPVNTAAETAGFWMSIQPLLTMDNMPTQKKKKNPHTINEVKKSNVLDKMPGKEMEKDVTKRTEKINSYLRQFTAADALPPDITLIIESGIHCVIERAGCELLSRTRGSNMEMYLTWPMRRLYRAHGFTLIVNYSLRDDCSFVMWLLQWHTHISPASLLPRVTSKMSCHAEQKKKKTASSHVRR